MQAKRGLDVFLGYLECSWVTKPTIQDFKVAKDLREPLVINPAQEDSRWALRTNLTQLILQVSFSFKTFSFLKVLPDPEQKDGL